MPVNWSDYPPDWKEIAFRAKEAAGWICQRCGLSCRKPGEPFDTHKRTLTVAHWPDPDPSNCSPENLHCWCAPCHLRADHAHHVAKARETRLRKRYEGRGQTILPMADKPKSLRSRP